MRIRQNRGSLRTPQIRQRLVAPLAQICTLLCVLCCSANQAAHGKLGQTIDAFMTKSAGAYKYKSSTKKADRSYYMFSMITDATVQQQAPNFAAGITITVVDKKIVGESMALRIGDNYATGKELATLHVMDFAYESLGKPAPANEAAANAELEQFSTAIDQVMAGNAQHVTYPGYNDKITMSRTSDGQLLVAVTPDFNQPAKTAEKGKSHK